MRGAIVAILALGVAPAGAATEPYVIARTGASVIVDGRLGDGEWRDATRLSLSYETQPGENIEPAVKTECLLVHDQRFLYVAFVAHDPDPAGIWAHYSDRDGAYQDDFVGIVLDPFNDERRGYEFFANPVGVQMDLFIDDVGGGEDDSWDAIWDAAGRIDEGGYVVEMAIPFSSLRFPRTKGPQTWGLNLFRVWPRDKRHTLQLQPHDRNKSCYLCQISKVTGFEGIEPGRNLELDPTLTGHRTDAREELPGGPLEAGDTKADVGLTASYAMTPNLTLGGTVNPDFSQVEADAAQLDVNTQFALYYPEKRPFFLEGADFFSTPINAVFTRNVADPMAGLKLTGKEEKNAFGIFVVQDDVTNILLPGKEGSSAVSLDEECLDVAARYRRDIGQGSTLGLLVTDREAGSYQNRVGGIDGRLRFSGSDTLTFQALGSHTRYGEDVSEVLPADPLAGWAMQATYEHSVRSWTGWARYEDLGREFRADLGFEPQVDTRSLAGGGDHTWYGAEGDWFTRISFGGSAYASEDHDGGLLGQSGQVWINGGGPRQSFLNLELSWRNRAYGGQRFDYLVGYAFLNVKPTDSVGLFLFSRVGGEIDYENVRQGRAVEVNPVLSFRPGRHWRIELDHRYQSLHVSGGALYTANLTQVRGVWQWNVRTFLRATVQYTDVSYHPELYLEPPDPTYRHLFGQLLFSYKVNPRTVLFVGYGSNQQGASAYDLTESDRTLFVKLGYAWLL